MNPKQLAQALAAGIITQDEHDAGVANWHAQQAERDATEKAEMFLREVEKAPLAQKKKLIANKALDLRVYAALADDRYEAKATRKKAYQLSDSLKGTGGISL